MSIIKSFAVGEGDMFYIEHNSNNICMIIIKNVLWMK